MKQYFPISSRNDNITSKETNKHNIHIYLAISDDIIHLIYFSVFGDKKFSSLSQETTVVNHRNLTRISDDYYLQITEKGGTSNYGTSLHLPLFT